MSPTAKAQFLKMRAKQIQVRCLIVICSASTNASWTSCAQIQREEIAPEPMRQADRLGDTEFDPEVND